MPASSCSRQCGACAPRTIGAELVIVDNASRTPVPAIEGARVVRLSGPGLDRRGSQRSAASPRDGVCGVPRRG